MSNRIVAALAAGALALGIFVGAAGVVLVGDVTAPDRLGRNGTMGQMMTMMGGSMMGGADFDDMAEWHIQHHGTGR